MERNFFGEVIFDRDDADQVLDALGVDNPREIQADIDWFDEEGGDVSITFKNSDDLNTLGHCHGFPSIDEARDFVEQVDYNIEIDDLTGGE